MSASVASPIGTLWRTIGSIVWASPCSLVGIVMAAIPLSLGGSIRRSRGALEVTYRRSLRTCGKFARWLPFRGIVFGHVILAVTDEELRCIGPHERVHVAQYERWGPLFLVAYPLASLWALLRGRSAYRDNCFEVEARALSACAADAVKV